MSLLQSTVKINPLNPPEGNAPDKHEVKLAIWLVDEHDDKGLERRRDSKVELEGPLAVCDGNGDGQHCL
jgi:hypothetical protein